MKDVEEIASLINEIIEHKVEKKRNKVDVSWIWEKHYKAMMDELEYEIGHTDDLIEDFKESKLPINAVEQEGYKRCLMTLVNRFKSWESDVRAECDEIEEDEDNED